MLQRLDLQRTGARNQRTELRRNRFCLCGVHQNIFGSIDSLECGPPNFTDEFSRSIKCQVWILMGSLETDPICICDPDMDNCGPLNAQSFEVLQNTKEIYSLFHAQDRSKQSQSRRPAM